MTPQNSQSQDLPEVEKTAQQPEQELTLEDLDQVAGGFNAKKARHFKKTT